MKKAAFLAAGIILAGSMAFGAVSIYDKDGMKVEIGTDVRVQEVVEIKSEKETNASGTTTKEVNTSSVKESLERAKLYINFSKGPVSGAIVTDKGTLHRDSFVKVTLADILYLQYNYMNNQMFLGDQLETKWESGKDSAIVGLYSGKEGIKAGMKVGAVEVFGGAVYDASSSETKTSGTTTAKSSESHLGLKGGATITLDKILKVTGEAALISQNYKGYTTEETDYTVTGFGANVRGELAIDGLKIKPEALMLVESQGVKKTGSVEDKSNKVDAATFAAAVKAEMAAMDVAVIANVQTKTKKDASDKDSEKTSSMYITPSVEFKKIIGDAGIAFEAKYAPKTVETYTSGNLTKKTETTVITPKVTFKYKF